MTPENVCLCGEGWIEKSFVNHYKRRCLKSLLIILHWDCGYLNRMPLAGALDSCSPLVCGLSFLRASLWFFLFFLSCYFSCWVWTRKILSTGSVNWLRKLSLRVFSWESHRHFCRSCIVFVIQPCLLSLIKQWWVYVPCGLQMLIFVISDNHLNDRCLDQFTLLRVSVLCLNQAFNFTQRSVIVRQCEKKCEFGCFTK